VNNALLQTKESIIKSEYLKERRKDMASSFRDLMFTSMDKKEALSREQETKKAKNNKAKKNDK
jgi:hypothetical protein